jgi:hypothetical protein
MEETSLAEEENNRSRSATVTVASTKETGTPSGATTDAAAADKDTIRRDHESGDHINDL